MKKFKIFGLMLIALLATSCLNSDETYTAIGPGNPSGGGTTDPGEDINTFDLKTITSYIGTSSSFSFNGAPVNTDSDAVVFYRFNEAGKVIDTYINLATTSIGGSNESEYDGEIVYEGGRLTQLKYTSAFDEFNYFYTYDSSGRMTKIVSDEGNETTISNIAYGASTITITTNDPNSVVTLTMNGDKIVNRKIVFGGSSNTYEAAISYNGNDISSVQYFKNGTPVSSSSYTVDSNLNPVRPLYEASFGPFFKYPITTLASMDEASFAFSYNVDIESYTLYMSEHNVTKGFYPNSTATGGVSLTPYTISNSYNANNIISRFGEYSSNIQIPNFGVMGTLDAEREEDYTYY